MSYRLDLTVIDKKENESRFALSLHNLTDTPLQNWSLHFLFNRFVRAETLSKGTISQTGSYCTLTATDNLPANGLFYTEFTVGTAPFTLYNDGILDAFISLASTAEYIKPLKVDISTINLDQPAVERYNTPLPVEAADIALIPKPNKITQLQGSFHINQHTAISTPPTLAQGAVNWLQAELNTLLNENVSVNQQGNIHYAVNKDLVDEGYRLLIENDNVWIQANSASGFVYATSSLLQLIPSKPSHQADSTYQLPMVDINDKPHFGYRGMMLDCGRHFHPVERIKHLIDQLARYKFNTFHWHLTDDEGWRVEIDAYPELTRIGAWRGPNEVIAPQFSHIAQRYGGFYSKQEIRDVIAYAADRGIMIIPEIDIPGHCRAAILSLPDLLIDPDDKSVYRSIQNYSDNILSPALKGTYSFISNVLSEICDLFPAPFVHIGADEVPVGVWTDSPACQKFMAEHDYSDPKELQGHLLRFAEEVLEGKGKRMMGWEEATHGEKVSKNTIIFSWQSEQAGLECIQKGYDIVMQPAQATYLDLAQGYSADEAGVDWAGKLPLDKVYNYYPLSDLSEENSERKHILGIQTALWSELVNNQSRFEYMIYPRLLAVSEICWSDPKHRNWDDFKARLKGQLSYLDKAGINYRHCE
ncbi:beta-N-acetylhexosaminidase [Photobacterium angustum]|uniref:beta-N-acetylhexosaminidase n=1 Tax=Photobacterium angustum TaxID=661 RepID=A0ABX5H447_PHOAN|nr:beta-N-acetylhexosaminidase [Photobacterium angustum]KJF94915.1 beta-hexosaminidase [Photobacterium angustum]KJG01553.1 beta-hexosaminidase [Photobacterium angustum]KJG06211.1 beta-hexosaminidase [Photobacterium angustum]KJG17211.1 beta-hexosaminidase [Photobacterium angustum]KJG23594.1 beta-hexosaminidase [Photobacterium angustum]